MVKFACCIELSNIIHELYSFSSNSLNFSLATILFRQASIMFNAFFFKKRIAIGEGLNYKSL